MVLARAVEVVRDGRGCIHLTVAEGVVDSGPHYRPARGHDLLRPTLVVVLIPVIRTSLLQEERIRAPGRVRSVYSVFKELGCLLLWKIFFHGEIFAKKVRNISAPVLLFILTHQISLTSILKGITLLALIENLLPSFDSIKKPTSTVILLCFSSITFSIT